MKYGFTLPGRGQLANPERLGIIASKPAPAERKNLDMSTKIASAAKATMVVCVRARLSAPWFSTMVLPVTLASIPAGSPARVIAALRSSSSCRTAAEPVAELRTSRLALLWLLLTRPRTRLRGSMNMSSATPALLSGTRSAEGSPCSIARLSGAMKSTMVVVAFTPGTRSTSACSRSSARSVPGSRKAPSCPPCSAT